MKNDPLALKIEECKNGNPNAFAWLIQEYGAGLYRFFLRSTGSTADAEDLLQDLFTKLLSVISKYEHDGRFESWLFQVAANLQRDYFRKTQRRIRPLSIHLDDDQDYSATPELAGCEPQPDFHLETAEQVDRLQQALNQLPPLDRQIIMLRHYSQMSFKDIAQTLEIPQGTALAKVHRGLKKIKNLLEQQNEDN